MAHDEELAGQLREALDGIAGISEKRMMGGLCFFHRGNMLAGADRAKSGERRFMFRVGKARQAEALQRPGAETVRLGAGPPMGGLVFVDAASCNPRALAEWVELALAFVSELPPK